MEIFDFLKSILDPDWIMSHGGLYLVLLILFIETGVFFGFFLPGDPLLFVAGMVIASAEEVSYPFAYDFYNLLYWIVLFLIATIAGYFLGYGFGHKFGNVLQNKEDTWLFKRKYILTAHEFYEKRGGFAIGVARFLPIVRTFAPIVGGMVKMDIKRFAAYNIIGAVFWVGGITSLGYVLGENPWVNRNLEYVIIGLVLIVTLPVIIKLILKKKMNENK